MKQFLFVALGRLLRREEYSLAMTEMTYFEMLSNRDALSRFKKYLVRKSFAAKGR